jgi:superfamily II DNA or RNA helicase
MIVDLTSDDDEAGEAGGAVSNGIQFLPPPEQPSMSAAFVESGSSSRAASSKDKLDSYLLEQELSGMIDITEVEQVRAETKRREAAIAEQRFARMSSNGNRRMMPGSVGGNFLGGRRLPSSFSNNHGTSALSKQAASSSSSSSFPTGLSKSNVPVPVQHHHHGDFQSANREAFLRAQNQFSAPGSNDGGWLNSHNNTSMAHPSTNVGLPIPGGNVPSNASALKIEMAPAPVNSGAYPSTDYLSSNVGLGLSSNIGTQSLPPVYVPPATISFFLVNLYQFTIRSDYGSIPDIKSLMDGLVRLPGFFFDHKKFQPVFDLNSYNNVENLIMAQNPKVNMQGISRDIIASAMVRREREGQSSTKQLRQERRTKEILINEYAIKTKLIDALAPFQQKGVHFICDRDKNDGRGLLADEMGLGKTRQAIGIMARYHHTKEWPVLVICPSSAKYHWKEEVLSLLQDDYLQPKDITIVEGRAHPIGTSAAQRRYKVVIISYGLLDKMFDQLKSMNFGLLVADECHIVKNSKTKRTKALQKLSKSIHRRLFMSGTPATNRPEELFSVLNMINPENPAWQNELVFKRRYCKQQKEKGKKVKPGQEFKGASNTHELHLKLTHPDTGVMIRRMKKDILKSLPNKQRSIVNVAVMDDDERQELRDIYHEITRREQEAHDRKKEKEALKQLKRLGHSDSALNSQEPEVDEKLDRDLRRNLLMDLFVRTGRAKVDAVKNHIDAFFADMANGKLLIFAHHQEVLNAISRHLKKKNIDNIRIDGKVKASTRFEYVERFQTNPECRAAVLGITAAGVALTLTAANNVFFAELYWTPGSLIQAEDRSHRIGQAQTVNVRYFLANGTVDELLWPLVKKKLSKLGEICEGEMNNQLSAKLHTGSIVSAGTDADGGIFGIAPASASTSNFVSENSTEQKVTSDENEKEAAPVATNQFMDTVLTSSAMKRSRPVTCFDSDDDEQAIVTSHDASDSATQNLSSSFSTLEGIKEGHSSSSTSTTTVAGKVEEVIADEALLLDMAQIEAAEERNAVSPKKGKSKKGGNGDDGEVDEQEEEDARHVNYGYDSDSSKRSNEDEDEEVEGLAADALITYYFNNLKELQVAQRLAARREKNKEKAKSPYTSSSRAHKLQKLDGDALHFDFTKENTNPSPSRPTRINPIILLDSDSDDDIPLSAHQKEHAKEENNPTIQTELVQQGCDVKAEYELDMTEAMKVTSNGTTQQVAASNGEDKRDNSNDSDSDQTVISLEFD